MSRTSPAAIGRPTHPWSSTLECLRAHPAMSPDSGPTLIERYEGELQAQGYLPDAAQRRAVLRLDALRARLLIKPPRGLRSRLTARSPPTTLTGNHGIYLYGGVGRGKTWLMDLFLHSLPGALAGRSHFYHFMRDVHARLPKLRSRRDPLEAVAKSLAAQWRVLCLDELYVSDIADAMILGNLFEALLRQGMQLVITSNQAPAELYRNGLQRERFLPTIALLERELEIISLEGGMDYRLRQMQRAPIYLDSGAADSAARLQRLFAELAGGSAQPEPEMRILGQTVPALGSRRDVVWFGFAALCEGPRSQQDYAEIAREFRTVLLSEVPVFERPEQDNAARRFIGLIDELYEQGTKLVLSAAAAPAQLYRGERLRLEFRRAASRLIEMQTEAYLGRERPG
jgi:cell division protein ZapE